MMKFLALVVLALAVSAYPFAEEGSGVVVEGSGVEGSGLFVENAYRMKRDTEETQTTEDDAAKRLEEAAEEIEKEALTIEEQAKDISENVDELKEEVEVIEKEIEELEGSGAADEKKCETLSICYDNEDCNGGQCLGAFLGTCNCNSCVNFWKCETHTDCGGLKNSCNATTGMCDCLTAHVKNGFTDSFEAFSKLCNVQKCGKETASSDCLGLPCNTGRCFC
ncbi:unnamed protein product [Auanema sp. JU1783]|nr:unnamed protein product [Auanema sp. JU1783]